MKIRSLLGAVALSLAFSPSHSESIIPSGAMDFAQLGMPYNTHTKDIHNFICVNADIDNQVGTPSAQFNFEHNMDYKKTTEALSGSLSVGVNYPMVKLGANANIVNEFITDEFSSSWTAYAVAIPDVLRLNPGTSGYQLSEKCQEYSNLYTTDPENMIKKAGDEFISQINLGASLLVQMRLKFANRYQKDQWDANAKFSNTSSWKLQIEGYLNSLTEKEKGSISIEIKAYQNGGVPGLLASVIPNDIMSCSISDVGACQNAFEDALIYVNDFGEQLSDPNHYNVLSFTTSKYTDAGLYQMAPPNSDVDPINEVYLDQLNSLFEQQLNDRNRSLVMLGEYSRYLENDWIQELEIIKRKTDQNTYMISRVADICYRFPYGNECLNQYTILMDGQDKLFKEYDRKYLYLPPVTVRLTIGGSEYTFTGDQNKFGENAKTDILDPINEIVISGNSNNPLDLSFSYADSCELYVDLLSQDSVQHEFIEPESHYNLASLHSSQLVEKLFDSDSTEFIAKLACYGLGSDLVVHVPIKVQLPASEYTMNTEGRQIKLSGIQGEYLPTLQTQNFSTTPFIYSSNQNPRFYYNLKNTNSCNISTVDLNNQSSLSITRHSGSFYLGNLITNEIRQEIENTNIESFRIKVNCYGLGGDLSYYIPFNINRPSESLEIVSFNFSGYRPDTDFSWDVTLKAEAYGNEQCHVNVTTNESNSRTNNHRVNLPSIIGEKSLRLRVNIPKDEYFNDPESSVPTPKATLVCENNEGETVSKFYQTTYRDWKCPRC